MYVYFPSSFFAFQGGPRGMVAGAGAGAALGLAAGVSFWLAELASGETVADKWYRELLDQNRINREKEEELKKYQKDLVARYEDWSAEGDEERAKGPTVGQRIADFLQIKAE